MDSASGSRDEMGLIHIKNAVKSMHTFLSQCLKSMMKGADFGHGFCIGFFPYSLI